MENVKILVRVNFSHNVIASVMFIVRSFVVTKEHHGLAISTGLEATEWWG